MRKIYSLLLMLVATIGVGLSAYADLTFKVNRTDTGAYVHRYDFTPYELNQESVTAPFPEMAMGNIYVPKSFTAEITNQRTGDKLKANDQGNVWQYSFYPDNTQDGDTYNIVFTESTGGGEEEDPVVEPLTFVFSPAGCGYVVTAHADEGGQTVEDEEFRPAEGSDEVKVPFDTNGFFIIKPNPGYSLAYAKDETDPNNSHASTWTPTNDCIKESMGAAGKGAKIVVSATKNGSFQVKGDGTNIENIKFVNTTDYSEMTITDEFQSVNFTSEQYHIYSSTSQLWKVEVTDSENYTSELSGDYGHFYYNPNDGDKVVIFTDKPEIYAKVKIGYEGEDVTKQLITKVKYAGNVVDETSWGNSDGWTVNAGEDLEIYVNTSLGFQNFTYKVNDGDAKSLTSGYDYGSGSYLSAKVKIENDNQSEVKEYNIVISAEKEKPFNQTFVCDHPDAVKLERVEGYTAVETLSFASSPYTRSVTSSTSSVRISAMNANWKIAKLTIDDEVVDEYAMQGGSYTWSPDKESTIVIEVENLASARVNTAIVYVASASVYQAPSIQYSTGGTVTLKTGYNEVPFGPKDRPFTFSFAPTSGSGTFYVNGKLVSSPIACSETVDFEDGGVIKYYTAAQTPNVVTYAVDDAVKDLVEIYHDHRTGIDHTSTTNYTCLPGTIIHIRPKAEVSQADVRTRAESTPKFYVSVNNTTLTPDDNGVYSYEVNDKADIKVTKDEPTGVEENFADKTEVFSVYNMQGVVVKRNATSEDLQALPSGIYVANGRKVVVK